VTKSTYEYEVTKNGTYKFISYSKKGDTKEESITVSNIDKTSPTGSCSGSYKDNISTINISASDNVGVSKYVINGVSYTSNKITVNKAMEKANITIYDKAGNTKNISCNLTNNNKKEPEKMDGYILIGDSRFVGMEMFLRGTLPNNVHIIAKESMGYVWFTNTAINLVNEILKNNPTKRYYIYSNLGINDLATSYASKLNELANSSWKKHKVVYISVNPYAGNYYYEKNQKVNGFNQNQKNQLNNVYYCDTYNGIGQSNFGCAATNDCLHYDMETSKKIYNYIINKCSF